MIKASNPVKAVCSNTAPISSSLLESLGFKKTQTTGFNAIVVFDYTKDKFVVSDTVDGKYYYIMINSKPVYLKTFDQLQYVYNLFTGKTL